MKSLILTTLSIGFGIVTNAMPPRFLYDGPILEKRWFVVFAPVEHLMSMECRIFENKVIVDIQKAENLRKHVEFILDARIDVKINDLIYRASLAELVKYPAPSDIGMQEYSGYLPTERINEPLKVNLGSVHDSEFITENQSVEAGELRAFIDSTCNAVADKAPFTAI